MKKILFLALTAISLVSLSACRKKMDTVAHIYVKDETNASVSNAMVVLYGTNTQQTPQQVAVFDTAYTNANGLATFNYNELYQLGQAGVAVLDIKAQKGNKIGQGIIKIEAEKVNEETVFIQP
jgi:protein involved in sex pheromone biosynthesis